MEHTLSFPGAIFNAEGVSLDVTSRDAGHSAEQARLAAEQFKTTAKVERERIASASPDAQGTGEH